MKLQQAHLINWDYSQLELVVLSTRTSDDDVIQHYQIVQVQYIQH